MSIAIGPNIEPRRSLHNAYSHHDNMAASAATANEVDPPSYSRYDDRYHQSVSVNVDSTNITPLANDARRHTHSTFGHARRPPSEYSDALAVEKRPMMPPRRLEDIIYDEDATPPTPEGPVTTTHTTETPGVIHVPKSILKSSTVRSLPPKLQRGLQIPSRMGVISSGFSLPFLLESQGVSKQQWKLSTHEL